MHKSVLVSTIALSVFLGGCAVGPKHKAPGTTVPATFGNASTNPFVVETPEVRWWSLFNDPTLNELIDRAVKRNHDLRIAQAADGKTCERDDVFNSRFREQRVGHLLDHLFSSIQ